MKLAKSPVIYDREQHTYTLDGVLLSGVTKMIGYQIAPDAFNGIPSYILERAAMRGSMVHDLCETYDNFGSVPDESDVKRYEESLENEGYPYAEIFEKVNMYKSAISDLQEYKTLTKGMEYLESEYIVNDENFASPVDKLFKAGEDEVDIADIKGISSLDEVALKKVTWQDSIYAYLFEKMNPTIKVRKLLVIWLPDPKYWTKTKKPCIKELKRISAEEIERLLKAEINDEKMFDYSVRRSERDDYLPTIKEDKMPAEIEGMRNYICKTFSLFQDAEKAKKDMVAKMKDAMEKFNIKSWTTDQFSFTRGVPYTKKSFDMDAFKAAYPEIDLTPFYKESQVDGSFTAKYKL